MFRIVTDTSSNLPTAYLQAENITVIPFTFHTESGEQSCMDTAAFDAKGGLSGLDRADGAEHVGENLAAVLQMRAVFCLKGHIVALVGKEDQIVVLRGKRACDRLIECFERLFVV